MKYEVGAIAARCVLLGIWIAASACGSSPPSHPQDGGADASTDGSAGSDAGPDGSSPSVGFVVGSVVGQPTEAGGTATFTVVLATMPTDAVAIGLSSNDTTEGTVAPSSLLFTTANWNVPQTVTITGVDDSIIDGAVFWAVVFGTSTSNDPVYSSLHPSDVSLHTTDDDVAGYSVSTQAGGLCNADGAKGTFTVQLTAQPSGTVSVPVSTASASLSGSPTPLVFDANTWNVPQTVTLTGSASLAAGTTSMTLGTPTTSDVWFAALAPQNVSVDVCDVGGAAIVLQAAGGGTLAVPLVTNDASPVAKFQVSLAVAPTSTVTLAITATKNGQEILSPTSLMFDASTWNMPQVVTLTGLDDGIAGAADFDILLTPSSSDARYAALPVAIVAVQNDVKIVDVALGATVTCGSCSGLGDPGANLVDGNPTTLAEGIAVTGSVIATVDLGKVVTPRSVTLSCIATTGGLPTLQVSTDGTTFTPLAYTSGTPIMGTGDVRYFRFIAGGTSVGAMGCSELTVMAVGP